MQTLREAMAAHQSGRIFEAENLYRRVLEVDDRQFPVLVMFGILKNAAIEILPLENHPA